VTLVPVISVFRCLHCEVTQKILRRDRQPGSRLLCRRCGGPVEQTYREIAPRVLSREPDKVRETQRCAACGLLVYLGRGLASHLLASLACVNYYRAEGLLWRASFQHLVVPGSLYCAGGSKVSAYTVVGIGDSGKVCVVFSSRSREKAVEFLANCPINYAEGQNHANRAGWPK
jgi:hypothetical protein